MERQSRQQSSSDGEEKVVLLGTTTLRRMLSAVYDKNDPLRDRCWYSECMGASLYAEKDPSYGDETVYVYYHPERNETFMTNIEGDIMGAMGSSAGFRGKVELQLVKETQKPKQK